MTRPWVTPFDLNYDWPGGNARNPCKVFTRLSMTHDTSEDSQRRLEVMNKPLDARCGKLAHAPTQRRTAPRRILVVEDDEDVRRLYVEVLIRSGFQVDTAEDGAAGWKALRAARHDPDSYAVLITDNIMPKMTGVELVRKLRAARMALPIILASGTAPTNTEWIELAVTLPRRFSLNQSGVELIGKLRAARQALMVSVAPGAAPPAPEWLELAAILPKPFSPDQLVQTVKDVLHIATTTRSY